MVRACTLVILLTRLLLHSLNDALPETLAPQALHSANEVLGLVRSEHHVDEPPLSERSVRQGKAGEVDTIVAPLHQRQLDVGVVLEASPLHGFSMLRMVSPKSTPRSSARPMATSRPRAGWPVAE